MPGMGERGLSLTEPLLFERSTAGRTGSSLPALDVPRADPSALFGDLVRREAPLLAELSEPEVVRHFVRLSTWNFSIDSGFYPLGSCTMKFNPKINEWAARLPGFARLHPYSPEAMIQGALDLMFSLERLLAEICGMDRVTLQPAAGAQGELTGLMMIQKYLAHRGNPRKKILIPDTAHGTNPASTTLNGYEAIEIRSGGRGTIEAKEVAAAMNDDVAAIMITNPNTCGLFERHIVEICEIVHTKGGLVYGDGANLNAILGKSRPGDAGIDVMQFNLHKTFTTPHGGGGPGCGPVGVKKHLEPYLPKPTVEKDGARYFFDYARPHSVGRVRSFYGNFGMMVRAYAYIREMGGEGLTRASELAVLNANYLRALLADVYPAPFEERCLHEVILTDRRLNEKGVTTMDVAKRLMDYGFHPPTVYFPLVVKGALMIEPTETETKETVEEFAAAMRAIAEEPAEVVQTAPHNTRLRRLDETRAARKPILRWTPPAKADR